MDGMADAVNVTTAAQLHIMVGFECRTSMPVYVWHDEVMLFLIPQYA